MIKTRARYSIQELLALLDIRPHVFRYWVDNIALIHPSYDDSGRRQWSAAQARLLLRLRHLIVERGMSVKGAEQAVVDEATNPHGSQKAQLETLRDLLLRLHAQSLEAKEATSQSGDDVFWTPQSTRSRQRVLPPLVTDEVYEASSDAVPDDCATVLYRHLSAARANPEPTLDVVRRVRDRRLAGRYVLVLAPVEDCDRWQNALANPKTFVVGVAPAVSGIDALRAALAMRSVRDWIQARDIATIALWLPEAAGPDPPFLLLVARAQANSSGISLAATTDGSIVSCVLSVASLSSLDERLKRADRLRGGRDLGRFRALEHQIVLLHQPSAPRPWSSVLWTREVEVIGNASLRG